MIADFPQDVMQVCLNGHVVTDLLGTHPEQGRTHCECCGAPTMERCLTCGRELPGAIPVPGLRPVGRRQPPERCPSCGAVFPWSTRQGRLPPYAPVAVLENLLRRLPQVARQLRCRHGDRPGFRIKDDFDLEDLLRALLPLHFDDIRPEGRTPRYTAVTRTDFLLAVEKMALVCKLVTPELTAQTLVCQVEEDVAYYQRQERCRTLVVFVYDPEQRLFAPRELEEKLARQEPEPAIRFLIAG
jgi:hypothetical protein